MMQRTYLLGSFFGHETASSHGHSDDLKSHRLYHTHCTHICTSAQFPRIVDEVFCVVVPRESEQMSKLVGYVRLNVAVVDLVIVSSACSCQLKALGWQLMVKIGWKDYWQARYEYYMMELLEGKAPIRVSNLDVQAAHIQMLAYHGQVEVGTSIEHCGHRMLD